MIIESTIVYAADSARGSQYGKFAAVTREDSIRLIRDEEWDGEGCEWAIGTPWGGAILVGDGEEEETRERYEALVAAAQSAAGLKQTLVWTTDRARADDGSRREAIERHNVKCAESAEYRRHYGEPIAL